MTDKTVIHPDETAACCCVDFGTVIDNSECEVNYKRTFKDRQEAEQMQKTLTEKARSIESEPCLISQSRETVTDGILLQMNFIFSCATERMIFQLALR